MTEDQLKQLVDLVQQGRQLQDSRNKFVNIEAFVIRMIERTTAGGFNHPGLVLQLEIGRDKSELRTIDRSDNSAGMTVTLQNLDAKELAQAFRRFLVDQIVAIDKKFESLTTDH